MNRWYLLAAVAALTVGCSPDPDPMTGTTEDGGVTEDANISDAGRTPDADSPDASAPDTGTPDMAAPDTGEPDDMGAPDMADEPPQDTSRSGQRLHRIYLDAGDGATTTLGMYDSQFQTNCTFREAVDGALRCLPTDTYELYFSDVGCTEPLHLDSPFSCETEWSRERSTGRIYRSTGTPANPTNGVWVRDNSGECREVFVQLTGDLYEAELVPAADFVEATRDELTANGMTVHYLDGEDGSRLLETVVHANYGYDCVFYDDGRCAPDRFNLRPRNLRYTDSNCTNEAYGYFAGTAPPVTAVRSDTGDSCASTYTYREVGARVTGDLYTENSAGDCVLSNPSSTYEYYEPGPVIDPASLPTATVETEGTGELIARRYRDADGNPLAVPHEFYDTTTDQACLPFGTNDGGAVCVPENYGSVRDTDFLDPACADPLAFGSKSCDSSTPATLIYVDGGDCELPSLLHVVEAFAPGASVGPDYYFDNGVAGGCRENTLPDSFSAWETGASNFDTFPALTSVVEEP